MVRLARKDDVKQFLENTLLADARATAGSNEWISRTEQARAHNPLIQAGAEQVRVDGGPGTWVHKIAATEAAMNRVLGVLRQVNQPQGASGHAIVSQAEVRAAKEIDALVGDALLQAYNVVRGLQAPPAPPSPEDRRKVLVDTARQALDTMSMQAVDGIPWQVRNRREDTSFWYEPLQVNVRVFANAGAVFVGIGASAHSPGRPYVGFHYVGPDPT